jgi:hypothetical protein
VGLFRSIRRSARITDPSLPTGAIDVRADLPTLTAAVATAAAANEERDRRIRIGVEQSGWEGCPTVEEIADATGLSAGELREIAAGPPHPAVLRRAVSEVDEPLPWDDHRGDRVLALADVAPQAQWWESEYTFFQDNPRRRHRFYSIQPDVYDVDPAQSWEVLYAGTGEVYARELITRSLHEIQVQSRDEPPAPEGWTMRDGALNGRCVLLGRLPSLELVRDTLNDPAAVVARRRGGLAWVYGRINLTNRILRAGFRLSGGFGDYGDPAGGFERAWRYLDGIFPESPLLPPSRRSVASEDK